MPGSRPRPPEGIPHFTSRGDRAGRGVRAGPLGRQRSESVGTPSRSCPAEAALRASSLSTIPGSGPKRDDFGNLRRFRPRSPQAASGGLQTPGRPIFESLRMHFAGTGTLGREVVHPLRQRVQARTRHVLSQLLTGELPGRLHQVPQPRCSTFRNSSRTVAQRRFHARAGTGGGVVPGMRAGQFGFARSAASAASRYCVARRRWRAADGPVSPWLASRSTRATLRALPTVWSGPVFVVGLTRYAGLVGCR